MNGDFIRNYGNVYHSILTECSNQSAGIQLADYLASVMYGYLRRAFIAPNNYAFAADLYKDYIAGKIRHNAAGNVMGFGVREVPSHTAYRQKLAHSLQSIMNKNSPPIIADRRAAAMYSIILP